MASTGRLTVACVVLAAGSMAGTAVAQTPSTETGRVLLPGATQEQNVITVFGGLWWNATATSSVWPTAPIRPACSASPSALTPCCWAPRGVRLTANQLGRRVRLEAQLNPVKYFTYTQLDHIGYTGSARWDWAVGSALYGDLGARIGQLQTSFIGTTYGGDKNLERRNAVFFTGGVRMTPSWSVFGHLDHENLDNSLGQSAFQAANFRATGTEAGVRYEPGTGAEIALLGRHTKATYPNLQTVDIFGTPIATPISNDYKQNAMLVRELRPNEDTRIAGDFGYTKREYDSVSSRNFSGPTARLGLDWRAGPGFFMATELIRTPRRPTS